MMNVPLCRDDMTRLELFLAGVGAWDAEIQRMFVDGR